jgi:hypothetical protein
LLLSIEQGRAPLGDVGNTARELIRAIVLPRSRVSPSSKTARRASRRIS